MMPKRKKEGYQKKKEKIQNANGPPNEINARPRVKFRIVKDKGKNAALSPLRDYVYSASSQSARYHHPSRAHAYRPVAARSAASASPSAFP